MKKKIITIFVLSIIFIFGIFFTTDLIRCKNNKESIFSINVAVYDDGGSSYNIGLFYNYYRVRKINPEIYIGDSCTNDCYITDYVITPWFFSLDYAKDKAFK